VFSLLALIKDADVEKMKFVFCCLLLTARFELYLHNCLSIKAATKEGERNDNIKNMYKE
jgi:hypothetical protein